MRFVAGAETGVMVIRFVGGFFAFIGILFATIGIVLSVTEDGRANARTATATATIVDVRVETRTDSEGHTRTSYYPTLRFEDDDHIEHEAVQSVSSGEGYEVGDVAEVSYDPRDPEGNAVLTEDLWVAKVLGWVFAGMGGLFALIGFGLVIGSLVSRG